MSGSFTSHIVQIICIALTWILYPLRFSLLSFIISKSDKGNSIVIISKESYHNKTQNFVHNNKFTSIEKDNTNKYQKDLRNTINGCPYLIHKDKKWKLVNLNPSPPTIRGLIKIHKIITPIRPIVNWREAPTYKLAKKLTKGINNLIPLPYTFNIKNSIQLMNDLMDIPSKNDLKFATFDITNMYTNIPTLELTNIINYLCKLNDIDSTIQTELKKICDTILMQNYFRFSNLQYSQKQGLAMGSPSSSVLSKIYLQFLENTKICNIVIQHQIIG